MRPLQVALVNNSAGRARHATETQFARILRAAAPDLEIRLRRFSCVPSGDAGGLHAGVDQLAVSHVDAVIATGMEPSAAGLRDEPAWLGLAALADWALRDGIPVLWSCLAAHAAVLHLDGIPRVRRSGKLFGVFDCEMVLPGHPLAAGLPPRFAVPHSRYHDMPETMLEESGYVIVSRLPEIGVDCFARPGRAPFTFFQGHPEYDAETLLLQFTRDVRRYLLGEQDITPADPERLFTSPITGLLEGLRDKTMHGRRDPALLAPAFRLLEDGLEPETWHSPSVRLFSNWLGEVVKHRDGATQQTDVTCGRVLATVETD